MSTIPYIADHHIDVAEPIKCDCEGWLTITRVCELDGVVVRYGSTFEGGDPWFARCGDCNVAGVEDFLHKMIWRSIKKKIETFDMLIY